MKVVVELIEYMSPEMFKDTVREALDILEKSENEFMKGYAQGMLDISKTVARIWIFYWPPRVEVEWVFEDFKSAERYAEALREFTEPSTGYRKYNGRELPAVRIDWTSWYTLRTMLGGRLHPLDIVVQEYLLEKSKKKAMKNLAENMATLLLSLGEDYRLEAGEDD